MLSKKWKKEKTVAERDDMEKAQKDYDQEKR